MAHPLLCWDIVMEGTARRKEFAADIAALQQLVKVNEWHVELERTMDNCIVWENKTIIVTNPGLEIVLATKNMFEMNGYHPGEVVGKNPGIFQGEATCPKSRKTIRTAVEKRLPFVTDIINYKRDGKLYTCHIEGFPVFNKKGDLVNFLALENAVQ